MKKILLGIACIVIVFCFLGCNSNDPNINDVPKDDDIVEPPAQNYMPERLHDNLWISHQDEDSIVIKFTPNGTGEIYLFRNNTFLSSDATFLLYEKTEKGFKVNGKEITANEHGVQIKILDTILTFHENTVAKIINTEFVVLDKVVKTISGFSFFNGEKITTSAVLINEKIFPNLLYFADENAVDTTINYTKMYAFSHERKTISVIFNDNSGILLKYSLHNFMTDEDLNSSIKLPNIQLIWLHNDKKISTREQLAELILQNNFANDLQLNVFNKNSLMDTTCDNGLWKNIDNNKVKYIKFDKNGIGDIFTFDSHSFLGKENAVIECKYNAELGYVNHNEPLNYTNESITFSIGDTATTFKRVFNDSIIKTTVFTILNNNVSRLESFALHDGNNILTNSIQIGSDLIKNITYFADEAAQDTTINLEKMYGFANFLTCNVTFINDKTVVESFPINNFYTENDYTNKIIFPNLDTGLGYWSCDNSEIIKTTLLEKLATHDFKNDIILNWKLNAPKMAFPCYNGLWIAQNLNNSFILEFNEKMSIDFYLFDMDAFKLKQTDFASCVYDKINGYTSDYPSFSYFNETISFEYEKQTLTFSRMLDAQIATLEIIVKEISADAINFTSINSFVVKNGKDILFSNYWIGDKLYDKKELYSDREGTKQDLSQNQLYAFSEPILKADLKFTYGDTIEANYSISNFITENSFINIVILPPNKSVTGFWSFNNTLVTTQDELYAKVITEDFANMPSIKWKEKFDKMPSPCNAGKWIATNNLDTYVLVFNNDYISDLYYFQNSGFKSKSLNVASCNFDEYLGYLSDNASFKYENETIKLSHSGANLVFKRNFNLDFVNLDIVIKNTTEKLVEFKTIQSCLLREKDKLLASNYWLNETLYENVVFFSDRDATKTDLTQNQLYTFSEPILKVDLKFTYGDTIEANYLINNFITENSFLNIVILPTAKSVTGFWSLNNTRVTTQNELYAKVLMEDFANMPSIKWKETFEKMPSPCNVGKWVATNSIDTYVLEFNGNYVGDLYYFQNSGYKSKSLNVASCNFDEYLGYLSDNASFKYENETIKLLHNGASLAFKRNLSIDYVNLEIVIKKATGTLIDFETVQSYLLRENGKLLTNNYWIGETLYENANFFSDRDATKNDITQNTLYTFTEDVVTAKLNFKYNETILSNYQINNFNSKKWFVEKIKIPDRNDSGFWTVYDTSISNIDELYNKVFTNNFPTEINVCWMINITEMSPTCDNGLWISYSYLNSNTFLAIQFDKNAVGVLTYFTDNYITAFSQNYISCKLAQNIGYVDAKHSNANLNYKKETNNGKVVESITVIVDTKNIIFTRYMDSRLVNIQIGYKNGADVSVENSFAVLDNNASIRSKGVYKNNGNILLSYFSDYINKKIDYTANNFFAFTHDFRLITINFTLNAEAIKTYDVQYYFNITDIKNIILSFPQISDKEGHWECEGLKSTEIDANIYNNILQTTSNIITIEFVEDVIIPPPEVEPNLLFTFNQSFGAHKNYTLFIYDNSTIKYGKFDAAKNEFIGEFYKFTFTVKDATTNITYKKDNNELICTVSKSILDAANNATINILNTNDNPIFNTIFGGSKAIFKKC